MPCRFAQCPCTAFLRPARGRCLVAARGIPSRGGSDVISLCRHRRPSGDRVLTSANRKQNLSSASKRTAAVGNEESDRAVGSGHCCLRVNKHRRHLCARQLLCRGASSSAKHRGRSICRDRCASHRQLGRIASLAISNPHIYRSARRAVNRPGFAGGCFV
jgi:hypothetical protein